MDKGSDKINRNKTVHELLNTVEIKRYRGKNKKIIGIWYPHFLHIVDASFLD